MIYLASRSPRRQELLARIGVRFELLAPGEDESEAAEALETPLPGEPPTVYVLRVTIAKARAGEARRRSRSLPPAPVLAADTTVAIGGRIIGKPADAAEAAAMLRALSGRSHRVLTAVALARGERIEHRLSVSRVRFARLTAGDIATYVASGDPFDKAGGYGIQGYAGRFVRRVEGSESGIMGLPLYETHCLLRGRA
ncbi:MAG: Maf family nucleotide pyrophosphatase [Burkholderiaceae bacterium]|jgi:septum formation protein|nr:Maf family nucleotide pyrophosphatase [Burkholderiaceae bacterium]MEB2319103.1 Maf family protein [Pseudomonadota bacterium]